MERCFICHKKMDAKTGLCTNPKCVRSKPLAEKSEVKEGESENSKGGDYHESRTESS